MMNFEERCLAITKSVTDIEASFFNGTMFLDTQDSEVATKVFELLSISNQSVGIEFGKCGQSETYYDFV
jgi:hypothetical protein